MGASPRVLGTSEMRYLTPARLRPAGAQHTRKHAPAVPSGALATLAEDAPRAGDHYDPAFHARASVMSLAFWSVYGIAVLAACALFFFVR